MESFSLHPDTVRKLARITRREDLRPRPWRGQRRDERMYLPGGGPDTFYRTSVARTDQVIPAALTGLDPADRAPSAYVTVQRMAWTGGPYLSVAEDVQIRSWVKTPSADPANEPGGYLYIYIGEDPEGEWWFIGQDCTEPETTVDEHALTTDTEVTTTLQQLPGTEFTAPTFLGVYLYEISAEIEVVGIPGNQLWDLDLGLYNVTEAQWEKVWSWAGAGDPLTNPVFNQVFPLELTSQSAGDQFVLAVVRATTTGTVTMLALDSLGNPATIHSLTGPL